MPCGHTDAEFALFTKTQKKILRALLERGISREALIAELEITDSTLRVHIANIKRLQSSMRVARATAQTEKDQGRQKEKFLPEMTDTPEPTLEDAPPLAHLTVRPPAHSVRGIQFEEIPGGKQAEKGNAQT